MARRRGGNRSTATARATPVTTEASSPAAVSTRVRPVCCQSWGPASTKAAATLRARAAARVGRR